MNTPTLSELADIGAKAAHIELHDGAMLVDASHLFYEDEVKAREAFAKAVLDAVGYTLPVDPEREAFDAWVTSVGWDLRDSPFEAWKAGRAARDKEVMRDKQPNPEADPPWIEWKGGKCPIPDTVRRWEYRLRGGYQCSDPGGPPSAYDWEGKVALYQVVAYRILDWGTTKQPE